jgi:hypothetical protein
MRQSHGDGELVGARPWRASRAPGSGARRLSHCRASSAEGLPLHCPPTSDPALALAPPRRRPRSPRYAGSAARVRAAQSRRRLRACRARGVRESARRSLFRDAWLADSPPTLVPLAALVCCWPGRRPPPLSPKARSGRLISRARVCLRRAAPGSRCRARSLAGRAVNETARHSSPARLRNPELWTVALRPLVRNRRSRVNEDCAASDEHRHSRQSTACGRSGSSPERSDARCRRRHRRCCSAWRRGSERSRP